MVVHIVGLSIFRIRVAPSFWASFNGIESIPLFLGVSLIQIQIQRGNSGIAMFGANESIGTLYLNTFFSG